MNEVKIDGFVLEDGVIQRWTGWYFDDIGSGHQACITIVHEGEFYPVLMDGAEFGYNFAYKEMNTEKMLKVLKDRDVIKSWYYNGAYHAEVANV